MERLAPLLTALGFTAGAAVVIAAGVLLARWWTVEAGVLFILGAPFTVLWLSIQLERRKLTQR